MIDETPEAGSEPKPELLGVHAPQSRRKGLVFFFDAPILVLRSKVQYYYRQLADGLSQGYDLDLSIEDKTLLGVGDRKYGTPTKDKDAKTSVLMNKLANLACTVCFY
ncbi:hypothetical protein F4802DRAFT_566394 [Xylaria palmicola]|nr:hypothetical protein F4802DRAFT_566394 [Xylaria palmicola]